jgi:uncharacterized protein YggE
MSDAWEKAKAAVLVAHKDQASHLDGCLAELDKRLTAMMASLAELERRISEIEGRQIQLAPWYVYEDGKERRVAIQHDIDYGPSRTSP